MTTLWGRCLSYGEGITYWPLREVLENAPESEERDAVLAALDAETPPPAPEIALALPRICEALARERPLVLVFDDVHWAERTFLELVEHLADRGEGPILVVCLAREELLEEHPTSSRTLERGQLALDALPDGRDRRAPRRPRRRDSRVRPARGSSRPPRATRSSSSSSSRSRSKAGLAERALPETVQALLAARLDRLGPGERAVLERGAVVGKEFRLDDVAALLEPEAAPTAGVHLQALAARGFVRPAGEASSVSVTCSCRKRSTAPRRSGCGRTCTSATSTGSSSGRSSPTSTSSSAITSSRRTGCGRSSESPIDVRRDSQRTVGGDLARLAFAFVQARRHAGRNGSHDAFHIAAST